MKHTLAECRVVLRELTPRPGVEEASVAVKSLEELFDYCLSLKEPRLLERLVLAGRDADGRARAVAFIFQSITEQHKL